MRIPAEEIKERITMRDIFEKYGLHADRRGFICCPFHREKTPSLGIYGDERRWHCFGCGESGDVIGFVQKYFDLSFNEAMFKIKYDFGLNIITGQPETVRERRRIAEKKRQDINIRNAERAQKDKKKRQYEALLAEWIRLDTNKRLYKPVNQKDEWHQLYIEALQKLDYQTYLLDRFEVVLK